MVTFHVLQRLTLVMFQARTVAGRLMRRSMSKSVGCTRCVRESKASQYHTKKASSTAVQSEAAAAPSLVGQRHGFEDSVVTLNVGGALFHTLRSTVACNEVLSDYVRRVDANPALAMDGAVFVDRDPKHFGVLLNHLRNKTEGLVRGVSCMPLVSFGWNCARRRRVSTLLF